MDLWNLFWNMAPVRDPALNIKTVWRELGPRPADKPAALTVLRAVMDQQSERLERVIAEYDETAESESSERLDLAAFDPSPGFDRSRRHQAALGRELLRTVDTLRRMRKEDARPIVDDDKGLQPGASATMPPAQPRGEEESLQMSSPRGWVGGSRSEATLQESQGPPTGAAAGAPPTQPRGEETYEHEIATSEAKPESTQDTTEMEVTFKSASNAKDDRTQAAVGAGNPPWDEIPILSNKYEQNQETDRNGNLSHESDPLQRE